MRPFFLNLFILRLLLSNFQRSSFFEKFILLNLSKLYMTFKLLGFSF